MTHEIHKYPRTPHLEGSRLQPGDVDDGLRLSDLPDGDWVWEEKLDGANTGISFDDDCNMVLQSRGHALQGGARERQFDKFKAWASANEDMLFDRLGTRHVAYFEWMAGTHSIHYDDLPHLAFEEDVLEKGTGRFLTTDERHKMFEGSGVVHVPILHRGALRQRKEVIGLIRRSLYQTPDWRTSFSIAAGRAAADVGKAMQQVDQGELSEGLYLKIEDATGIVGRYKWVRSSFLQTILDSGTHWQSRPLIENQLAPGVDIMAAPAMATP